ncbi:class I SAM-dependent methyltransferase [Pseudodesulfovibrio tunisiensis]|uniref:class I SAM-dependent methyltransferase n=1 Tax=Pseudodesulfovibrio tunisiensis TaxID=463192 RepID=UPI001FB435B2|nr:class I SAM-dependent methyltransferase [Pseudodesulfovibrio tunisiensis]
MKILDKIAADSIYAKGICSMTIPYSFKIFKRWLVGNKILELGPAEGLMTEQLVALGKSITVVEGALGFCEIIKKRCPAVKIIHSLFEDFSTTETFDHIILGHVLEHVKNPVGILKQISRFLTPQGTILSAVPNARSIHRQAATIMGITSSEYEASAKDKRHGHQRIYSPESFRSDFVQAGLKIDHFGGYWLKPLADKQIEQSWSTEQLAAFMVLGERYPDIAAEIYIIASRP